VTEPTPDTADNARTDQRDPTGNRATVTIAATAETVWDMVADVTRMGEWSPECYACRWIGKRHEPVVGARFAGFNKRGRARWVTTNEVVEAERGRTFVFRTRETGVRWGYRFEPSTDGAGITLTETRDTSGARAWLVRMAGPFVGGADSHADELRAGMRRTLERVKAAAEATP
jgi:dimethylaniline monooxygenase (N-oxide forming)